jgi:phosphoribosylformylglycinamidine synthase
MWQFSQAIDGLGEACNALGTPITGGNVSFYNETLGKSIYPTPVIGILGVIEDASRVMKIAFREEGDLILLLDSLNSGSVVVAQRAAPLREKQREFSSSEYSKSIGGIVAGDPPAIDLAAEKRLIDCLVALAGEGFVQSAHDISDGGFAVTLAESCFASFPVGAQHVYPEPRRAAPHLGAIVYLDDTSVPTEYALFSERGARAIVSVSPAKLARVLETARQCGVEAHQVGKVVRDAAFRIQYEGRTVIDSSVDALRDIWANSLERSLKVH